MQVASAEGLKECKKLMALAKAGRYQGYLLEGMACPGGCVAGAGTRQPVNKAQAFVKNYAGKASHQTADQTESVRELKHLVGGKRIICFRKADKIVPDLQALFF